MVLVSTFLCGFTNDKNCEYKDLPETPAITETEKPPEEKKFIKWVDFNASRETMNRAQKAHKTMLQNGISDIGTCEFLAYCAIKNGNTFKSGADKKTLDKLTKEIIALDRSAYDKYAENKYFKYYRDCFHAVLDGIIDPTTAETVGHHPIAKNRWISEFDDFGAARTFGFKRKHLGHDIYGGVGTPIIAVEGGTITELGWNRYGGWRIGVRSDDTKRYYYYAHLKRNKPYPENLKIGDRVNSGDVIGYLGVTGYSSTPNKNMTGAPHLHFGIQIIFDPSQEDGNGEIWIDPYQICKFLSSNRVIVE